VTNKSLYFICPTDCLEPVINNGRFGNKNHFYTSLGNSVVFDKDIAALIKELLQKHHIKTIYFVLSNGNPIVNDALENQDFSKIRGLKDCYDKISKQKRRAEILTKVQNRRFKILSFYLNKKIKELKQGLDMHNVDQIKITGIVFNSQQCVFDEIYPDSILTEFFSLN